MTPDLEDRISDLLHAIAFEPHHDISVEQVRARAGRQRTNRLAVLGAALAVAAVAVAVPVALRGSTGASTTRPTTTTPSHPTFRATVLGVDSANRLVIENPSDPASVRIVTYRLGFPDNQPIAGAGGAGWVTSVGYGPSPNKPGLIRPATVGADGAVHPFGPAIRDGSIDSLAVSTDGSELAMGVEGGSKLEIRILPMPGYDGPRRTWRLPSDDQLINLSWSPDGTTLSYVAGSQTGDGIERAPEFLDARVPGRTAPTTPRWPAQRDPHCQVWGASWIDATGAYAGVAQCGRSPDFVSRLDPHTGRTMGARADLPGSFCNNPVLNSGSTTGRLLVIWCDKVYFVRHGRAYLLPGDLTDAVAAWVPPGGSTGG